MQLCGNLGDPIYHPEFVELCEKLKNRGAELTITTNGSYKSKDWWAELTNVLDNRDTVIFSIDGTPKNFSNYRVNGDWESIEVGINECANSMCRTTWKFIPFNFNETQLDEVRKLSVNLGIDEFIVQPSSRFDQHTMHLKPSDTNTSKQYVHQVEWKQNLNKTAHIQPKCASNKEHYISADGYYTTCCYVADYRFYYKTTFGKNKEQYRITNNTLSAMINSASVTEFEKDFNKHAACVYTCGGQ